MKVHRGKHTPIKKVDSQTKIHEETEIIEAG